MAHEVTNTKITEEEHNLLNRFRSGVYKHYKGPEYVALFVARDSTNGPDEGGLYVVYWSFDKMEPHVRKLSQWVEVVDKDTGLTLSPYKQNVHDVERFSFKKHLPFMLEGLTRWLMNHLFAQEL